MARPPAPGRLAYFPAMLRGGVEERGQSGRLQVRLISQHDGPMGQTRTPSAPANRALNGTEHAAAWVWIRDSVLIGKSEPVQFRVDRAIRTGADHGNLMRSQTRPERQQMSQHGGFAP